MIEGGGEVVLTAGKVINTTDLRPGADKHVYARVKKQDTLLYLTNLSTDTWTVTSPASDKTTNYANGEVVTLRQDMKIVFNKKSTASVTFRNKAS